jgi:hypothetical protein
MAASATTTMESEQEPKQDIEALSNSSQIGERFKGRNDEKEETIRANPISLSPPPNGGTLAWLQVLGCFFLWFGSL